MCMNQSDLVTHEKNSPLSQIELKCQMACRWWRLEHVSTRALFRQLHTFIGVLTTLHVALAVGSVQYFNGLAAYNIIHIWLASLSTCSHLWCCRTTPGTRFNQSIKESINSKRWRSPTVALVRKPRPLSFYWANNSPATVCWCIMVIKHLCVCVSVCACWTNKTWFGSTQPVQVFSPLEGLLQDLEPLPPTAADRDDVLPSPLLGLPAPGHWHPAGPPHHWHCRDALCRTWWVDYNIIIWYSLYIIIQAAGRFFRCTTSLFQ